MKISLNWVKEYLDFELPPVNELVTRIGAQLGGVEAVENLGEKYRGIIIVNVVSCIDHPDSDHLHVCKVDDGGVAQDVERDADGLVQVVCGAPNVHAGMLAAWLPPGSTVPDTAGTEEPFVLGKRPLRGVVSNGMLASPRELALGDSHEGILEIDASEWSPNQAAIKPGADFAQVFGLDDYIIEVENKMFTHRPDCFGQLGVAREIAGILGKPFKSPEWYAGASTLAGGNGLDLTVQNETPEKTPRLMAVALDDVTVKPSPLWLQVALVRVGAKPINNIVDVTNYIMLLTAQPTHAYDYDKLRGHQLVARMARPDERVTLLNHKSYKLTDSDIVIADAEGPIGLAGIMGGADSEVSEDTKRIVLECANFDMYTLRRSSMRHGVFTDALTRFNKGQSPIQNPHVLQLLVQSVNDVAGGTVASPVFDEGQALTDRQWVHPPVPVASEFINSRLGLDLPATSMQQLLQNVECQVAVDGEQVTVTAPFWRTDIETREDVIEEVGRLYGFDKLPLALPRRSITPPTKDALFEQKARIRDTLAKAGANEVLTYSFVHGDLLGKVGQESRHAFELGNALSPDLQYYRTGLTASLLDKVHANQKAGFGSFGLFELGKVHFLGEMDPDESTVPNEDNHVAFVLAYSDKTRPAGAPYFHARHFLEQIANLSDMDVQPLADFALADDVWGRQLTAPYDPARSAVLVREGLIWGVVGEFRPAVRRAMKLPVFSAGFEIHLALAEDKAVTYQALPRFPKVSQDITLRVPASLPYQTLFDSVSKELLAAKPPHATLVLNPLDIYQKPDEPEHKQITFRVSVASYEQTLTDKIVAKLLATAATAAKKEFGADQI